MTPIEDLVRDWIDEQMTLEDVYEQRIERLFESLEASLDVIKRQEVCIQKMYPDYETSSDIVRGVPKDDPQFIHYPNTSEKEVIYHGTGSRRNTSAPDKTEAQRQTQTPEAQEIHRPKERYERRRNNAPQGPVSQDTKDQLSALIDSAWDEIFSGEMAGKSCEDAKSYLFTRMLDFVWRKMEGIKGYE